MFQVGSLKQSSVQQHFEVAAVGILPGNLVIVGNFSVLK